MNKCWYPLNIDNSFALRQSLQTSDALVKHFDPTGPENLFLIFKDDLPSLVSVQWLDYMKSLNLEVSQCFVFYRPTNSHNPYAHVDQPRNQSKSGITINWTLTQSDRDMIWYSPSTASGLQRNKFNTQYEEWHENSLIEIDRYNLGQQPTLLRTDVPHNISKGNIPRWSFSFRSVTRFDSWEHNIQHVQNLII